MSYIELNRSHSNASISSGSSQTLQKKSLKELISSIVLKIMQLLGLNHTLVKNRPSTPLPNPQPHLSANASPNCLYWEDAISSWECSYSMSDDLEAVSFKSIKKQVYSEYGPKYDNAIYQINAKLQELGDNRPDWGLSDEATEQRDYLEGCISQINRKFNDLVHVEALNRYINELGPLRDEFLGLFYTFS